MKRFLKLLLYAAIFLAIYYLVVSLVGDLSVSVRFGKDDAITLTGPGRSSVSVLYSDIDSIELIPLPAPGEKAGGGSSRSWYWGTWKNEKYGEYSLFASKKSSKGILIRTSDGNVVIFNQESDSDTENTYKMFELLLADLRS